MKFRFIMLLLLLSADSIAQGTQQVRGTIIDQVLQKPLPGVTVTISETGHSAITDEEGVFRFKHVTVGLYRLTVSYAGFKTITLDNITVNAGKETILTVTLEALVKSEEEVVLKANSKRNKPLNDLSMVSARAFTVEETQKYAAAVNDPLRMAAAFPGVLAGDDGNNSIIIRGNSPVGLLWKMEGMDIPNPNHFSAAGNSGGGISILSSQLLANSDFVTAAFAAEYGNARSGVFDLKLRKGNNEKKEYAVQAGVLGINLAAEGPFSKNYKGSYLVNFRYSTLELLNKMGVLPDNASSNFQDLSYNIYLPTRKAGTFSFFGFGGLSKDVNKTKLDSTKWEEKKDRLPYQFTANTGMSGLTHTFGIGSNATLKTGIGYSCTLNSYDENEIQDDYSVLKNYKDNYKLNKWLLNSVLNYRISKKLSLRAGVIASRIQFNYYQLSREHENDPLLERINTKGNTSTQQAFAQWHYKPGNNLSLTAGLHYQRLSLNGTSSLEPRASARWNINANSSLAIGYGRHSQLQLFGVYFARHHHANGSISMPNRYLGFTKADHYVLSFGQKLGANLLLKTELYYQRLFNVPVSLEPNSSFSTINILDGYVLEPMGNTGSGKNYGIEISLERYLKNNFYLTLTNSIYQSRYTAADGIERNTRFNGNYISTLIAGKDFVSENRKKTFGINIKTIYAGGLRTTPIDLAASQQAGFGVYKEGEAFTLKNKSYFRTDFRASLTWNKRGFTSTLSLDLQNLTNRLNVYDQSYDANKHEIVTNYQTGLIPVLNYKIEF